MSETHYLGFEIETTTDCNGDLVVSEPYITFGKKGNKMFFSVGEILDTDGNIKGYLPPKLVERLVAERKERHEQEMAEMAADRRFDDELEAMHEARG